jgi:signal transduction histidine kinase
MSASALNNNHRSGVGQWSLRTRLIALLLLATAGLWTLASYSVYREAEQESRELFDESLREAAYLLLTMVQHEMAEHGINYTAQMIDAADVPGLRYLRFQVWGHQGQLIYRSQNAPPQPLVSTDGMGYAWAGSGADSLRTYVAWNADRQLQIQIAEPISRRQAMTQRTLWRLALFALLFLPLSVFLVWWIISRSFAPIQWTSKAVAMRTGHRLEAIELDNVPREIAPLIVALNRLLEQIRTTLDHERRFTADAAHELRTPLAAIHAHAQVLQAARSGAEAREAAQDIIVGVDRSQHLVEQLLALARLEGKQWQATLHQVVDIGSLVEQQLEEHYDLAERRHLTLLAHIEPASVEANLDHLAILLRNLIDNALRYTPEGGTVKVSCGMSEGIAFMAVHDSGVGIPQAERQHIFGRFYRIHRLGGSDSYGSGLGLSIVQQLAEHYGAFVGVEEGLEGVGVGFVVRFNRSIA